MYPTFSYKEYKNILAKYYPIFCDYTEVKTRDTFALLRHDVEFDIPRALKVAELDSEFGLKSSFLFQVKSDAYNLSSINNQKCIQKILALGHYVGLHFYVSHIAEGDWPCLYRELELQRHVFELVTQIKVDRFSFHRPPKWVLEKRSDEICGLINMYGPSFFEYTMKPQEIKYLADSMHRFSYSHPLDELNFKKYQILLHPDEWSEDGCQERNNFLMLIEDNSRRFKMTLTAETKNYVKYNEMMK